MNRTKKVMMKIVVEIGKIADKNKMISSHLS